MLNVERANQIMNRNEYAALEKVVKRMVWSQVKRFGLLAQLSHLIDDLIQAAVTEAWVELDGRSLSSLTNDEVSWTIGRASDRALRRMRQQEFIPKRLDEKWATPRSIGFAAIGGSNDPEVPESEFVAALLERLGAFAPSAEDEAIDGDRIADDIEPTEMIDEILGIEGKPLTARQRQALAILANRYGFTFKDVGDEMGGGTSDGVGSIVRRVRARADAGRGHGVT